MSLADDLIIAGNKATEAANIAQQWVNGDINTTINLPGGGTLPSIRKFMNDTIPSLVKTYDVRNYGCLCDKSVDDSDNFSLALLAIRNEVGTDAVIINCGDVIRFDKKVTIPYSNFTLKFGEVHYGSAIGRLALAGKAGEYSRRPDAQPLQLSASAYNNVNDVMVLPIRSQDIPYIQVGDRIIIRGQNDIVGNTLERQIVFVTAINGNDVICSAEKAYTFNPTYPSSDYPNDVTKVTLAISSLITSDVTRGMYVVPVADASVFQINDMVQITDQTLESDYWPPSMSYKNPAKIEYGYVIAVNTTNNTVTLDSPIAKTYSMSMNACLIKIVPVSNTNITINRITYATPQTTKVSGLELGYTFNCLASVGEVYGYNNRRGHGIILRNSLRSGITDSFVNGAGFHGSGEGYGIVIYTSTDCSIKNSKAQACRHNFLLQSTTRCTLQNVQSYDDIISGIDLHGVECVDTLILNPTITCTTITRSYGEATTHAAIRIGNYSHLVGDNNTTIIGGCIWGYPDGYAVSIVPNSKSIIIKDLICRDVGLGGINLYSPTISIAPTIASDVILDGVVFERCKPLAINGTYRATLNKLTITNCISKDNAEHFAISSTRRDSNDVLIYINDVLVHNNTVLTPTNSQNYAYSFIRLGGSVACLNNTANGDVKGIYVRDCTTFNHGGNKFTIDGTPLTNGGNTTVEYVSDVGAPVNVSESGSAFPSKFRVATLGTSLVQQNTYSSSSGAIGSSARSWIDWCGFFSNGACEMLDISDLTDYSGWGTRKFVGTNFGVSGQTCDEIIARLPTVIANKQLFEWLIFDMGTNDMGSLSKETIFDKRSQAINTLVQAGIKVIVLPILARHTTVLNPSYTGVWAGGTAERMKALWINQKTRDWCRNKENVIFHDWNHDWVDNKTTYGVPKTQFTNDGTHFGASGGYYVGKGLWERLLSLLIPQGHPRVSSPEDLFDATNNPYGVVSPNPFLQGSVAITGVQNVTGVRPTGWQYQIIRYDSKSILPTTPIFTSLSASLIDKGSGEGYAARMDISLPLNSYIFDSSTGTFIDGESLAFTPEGGSEEIPGITVTAWNSNAKQLTVSSTYPAMRINKLLPKGLIRGITSNATGTLTGQANTNNLICEEYVRFYTSPANTVHSLGGKWLQPFATIQTNTGADSIRAIKLVLIDQDNTVIRSENLRELDLSETTGYFLPAVSIPKGQIVGRPIYTSAGSTNLRLRIDVVLNAMGTVNPQIDIWKIGVRQVDIPTIITP